MSQPCLTQYFTPKRCRLSSTVLANGESLTKSSKRKIKFDDENIENRCESKKKRRISAEKPTDSFLPECDLDQIDKVLPLSRKNRFEIEEKKVKTFEREKKRLPELVDLKELRENLDAVRNHLATVKKLPKNDFQTPTKIVPAHERFENLLVEKPSINETEKKISSPADLRRFVKQNENQRLEKVLSKIDQSTIGVLPTTPSKKITGVNSRLVEQIRLKEQARTQLNSLETKGLIVNEEQRSKTLDKLHYLRESVEIVDQLFTTERQVALEVDKIQEKIRELHSAKFNQDQTSDIFNFVMKTMEQCAEGYLTTIKLRNKQYVKINRTKFSLFQLNEFIQEKLQELNE